MKHALSLLLRLHQYKANIRTKTEVWPMLPEQALLFLSTNTNVQHP